MIEINDVTKQFYDQLALNHVTLNIADGEVVGLLGPNGAGKSTLMKIIAGLYQVSSGTVRPTADEWPAIGYKPERLLYPNHLRVRDYLKLVANLSNIPNEQIETAVERSILRVGLVSSADKRIKHCSKGMRQRIGMAQILIGDPQLILLDEPSNGLDPSGQKEMIAIIKQLQSEGKTIIMSSHQLHEVTQVCTQLVILSQGEVRYQESVADAVARQAQTTIQADKAVTAVAPLISTLHPDIAIRHDKIILKNEAMYLRRQVLAILISNGFDIVYLDQQRKTLDEIYAEAIDAL